MRFGNRFISSKRLNELVYFGMAMVVSGKKGKIWLCLQDRKIASKHIIDIVRIVGQLRPDKCFRNGTGLSLKWD